MRKRLNRRDSLLLVLFFVGYFGAKTTLDSHLRTREHADIRYLPSPRVAQILAFGYKSALADIYWIEAINYYGEQLVNKKRTLQYLNGYVDLIFSLDPHFVEFYKWAATAYIYNALPITRERIIKSMTFVNHGIVNLQKIHRFEEDLILKGAFNFAIEATDPLPAIPYFQYAARSFSSQRDMFLVASAYAFNAQKPELSSELKLEYLGFRAFEAQSREEIQYAYNILASPRMNLLAKSMVRAIRLKLEKDEDIRRAVAQRLKEESIVSDLPEGVAALPVDPRFTNVLQIDLERTWLPPELLVLFSL